MAYRFTKKRKAALNKNRKKWSGMSKKKRAAKKKGGTGKIRNR